jgi:hypothetical protein
MVLNKLRPELLATAKGAAIRDFFNGGEEKIRSGVAPGDVIIEFYNKVIKLLENG